MASDAFKPLEFQDKELFNEFLRRDPPRISELTFTNLYMWRHQYHPAWLQRKDCLLIVYQPKGEAPFGLPPIGAGNKREALDYLAQYLTKQTSQVRICRVDEDFVNAFVDPGEYVCTLDRDNSDYVYLAQDLINLSGRRYHRKKNHLNQFKKNFRFEYRPLDKELVDHFMQMQQTWCRMRECVENPELLVEDFAVHEALSRFDDLDYRGGAIVINDGVEAFSLGESLNRDTAVIHIEKANPDIPGLYAAINQLFCANAWSGMTYINREQDLGSEGLRKAKESYLPHHMVNKYTVVPK